MCVVKQVSKTAGSNWALAKSFSSLTPAFVFHFHSPTMSCHSPFRKPGLSNNPLPVVALRQYFTTGFTCCCAAAPREGGPLCNVQNRDPSEKLDQVPLVCRISTGEWHIEVWMKPSYSSVHVSGPHIHQCQNQLCPEDHKQRSWVFVQLQTCPRWMCLKTSFNCQFLHFDPLHPIIMYAKASDTYGEA